jgi:hypothetical protein
MATSLNTKYYNFKKIISNSLFLSFTPQKISRGAKFSAL